MESVKQNRAQALIAELCSQGLHMAEIERTFRLPKRTFARWKKGTCSASGIALLELIYAYPWLLDLAKSQYDIGFAKHLLVKQASFAMEDLLKNARDYSGNDMHV